MRVQKQMVNLLNSEVKDYTTTIETYAKLCTGAPLCSDRSSIETFVRSLRDKGHHSVFEHISATFLIVTNRGISHELVRHRIASFTQESTRYIDMSNLPLIAPYTTDSEDLGAIMVCGICVPAIWFAHMKTVEDTYRAMWLGIKRKDFLRGILPNDLATRLVMTANLREWRHILELRLSKGAHPQMRELAGMILAKVSAFCPVYFEDLTNEGL